MKHLFRTLALLLVLVPATVLAQEDDSTAVMPTADTPIGWLNDNEFGFTNPEIGHEPLRLSAEKVRQLLNGDVVEFYELRDKCPTPLQQKRFLESEEGASFKAHFASTRRALLATRFMIINDLKAPYDLERHNFCFDIRNDLAVIETDDPRFEREWFGTTHFTTTEIDEDTAYEIETHPKVVTTFVRILDEERDGGIRVTPVMVLIVDNETAQVDYAYEVQPAPEKPGTKTQACDAPQPEEAPAEFAVPETPASYPGGETALFRDLNAGIVYPAVAMENGIQGRVVVRFTIDEQGAVTQPAVTRSLSPECDDAALTAVRKLRHFTPATTGGKPVKSLYTIPITFRLQ